MKPPWIAEREVDEALARKLVRRAFPAIAADDVLLLGAGWDNTNYLVDGAHVFRFPRRELAVALLKREIVVLPAIAAHLPLPVPQPEYVSTDGGELYPWPFFGYPFLPGTDAVAAACADVVRDTWAKNLARFLAALHALPIEVTRPLRAQGIGSDSIRRLDFAARWPAALERMAAVRTHGLVLREERVHAIRAGVADAFEPRQDVLVHGDLHAAQILIDAGEITGVADWGDVHFGDPVCDLALAHTFFSEGARAVFWETYGSAPAATRSAARLHGLAHTLAVALYALETSNAPLTRDVRTRFENLGVLG